MYQTRLTKREQQNLANQMSSWAIALKKAIEDQDWEKVKHVTNVLDAEAIGLTHRTMGL